MVWIPADDKHGGRVGERVKLIKDITVMAGTMKAGTEVTIINEEQMRGYSYEDDEGHRVIECGYGKHERLINRGNTTQDV